MFGSDYVESGTFQFHKGSIKTLSETNILPCLKLFQFHKGSIKTVSERSELFDKFISIP